MKKKILALFGFLSIYAIAVPVFAYMYFYRTDNIYVSAGVVLQSYPTPTMQLGFYWDEACTQPIASFDFGQMIHPNQEIPIWKRIYIRNEGDVWHEIHWNSTLSSVTGEINEWWSAYYWFPTWGDPLDGIRLDPGVVQSTWYGIKIPAYATVGTYNWTLTVWGEHYY